MKSLKIQGWTGVALTLLGSFLPWERTGGFAGSVIYGLRVDMASFQYWMAGIHQFPVYDYGGMLVILLTLIIILLAVHPPGPFSSPLLWILILSHLLFASSLAFVGRWIFHRYAYPGNLEQPSLMIGLICILPGSVLLCGRAIMLYRGKA